MTKNNYDNWTKDELIKEVKNLKKQKTYGLVWEEDKTKEDFDYYINWEGEKNKESFGEEEGKFPVLKEVQNKSIDNGDSKYNLMIEGDNYHSLAVLSFTHNKSIDVIYIDPPYNTGNKDFVYNDKIVDKEDGFRHSKWLSFMSKRLKLAKNLLKESGVIFISIDNNEFAQLKILCDDIFGEKNFIGQLIIQSNPRGSQASKHLADVHEYVLVYAKSSDKLKIKGFSKEESVFFEYPSIDKEGKRYRFLGLRQRGGEWRREQRPNMFYPFYVNPKDSTVSLKKTKTHYIETLPKRPTGEEGRWTWSPKKSEENINLLVGKKVNRKGTEDFYDIFRINYYNDEEGNGTLSKPKTIWTEKELNYQNGRTEVKQIFSGRDIFDYPKPTYLIKRLVEMTQNRNSIILDFFAGSGTTGHAVMQLNKEDGGKRKFILCTNNESNNGTGLKIATDICYPRIKRVIEGYKDANGNKMEGYKDNFKYFKTDFVESATTDQNKKKIVGKSTEMLCIKENAFKLVKEKEGYKIFKNTDIHLGIIFDEEEIDSFIKDAKEIKGKFNVYVFSLDDSVPEKEFRNMKGKVKLCPIPEAILHVYRRIFK